MISSDPQVMYMRIANQCIPEEEMNKSLARSIQLVNEIFCFTASQDREGREIAEVERESKGRSR